jgi:ATP-dependent DNA helicase RecQ
MKKKQHRFFGKTLKKMQAEALKTLENGHSLICHFHTGYGKTLIWQSYAQLSQKNVIVITPLKIITDDQLSKIELSATKIDGNTNESDRANIIQNFGKTYQVLYISPESFCSNNIIKIAEDSLIVFDEAHCILSHGQSFRKKYIECFNMLKDDYQVLLLSATLSTSTVSFLKNNIFSCMYLEKFSENHNIIEKIIYKDNPSINDLRSQITKGQKTLIFCWKRTTTEITAEKLQNMGYKAEAYNSTISDSKKLKIAKNFKESKIDILVSTSSFEMGVDVPDIKKVLFYDLPMSLQSYIQQRGRGGRDGKDCEVIIFYSAVQLNLFSENFIKSEIAKEDFQLLLDYFSEF